MNLAIGAALEKIWRTNPFPFGGFYVEIFALPNLHLSYWPKNVRMPYASMFT